MRHLLIVFLTVFIFSGNEGIAGDIQAYFAYAAFYSPASGPYVETYLSVIGNTVIFAKNDTGLLQSEVEVILIFSQDETITYFDKYRLLSPSLRDSASIKPNFIDQKRIPLAEGIYDVELQVKDLKGSGIAYRHTEKIMLAFPGDKVILSDIQLVESSEKSSKESILTKSGFDLVPYVSNFYPETMNNIRFYGEVYNSSKILGGNEGFLANFFIESYETGKKQNSFARFSRLSAREAVPFLSDLPIAKLPSGNYNLVIEIRDKTNSKIADKKVFFQRSNPSLADDTMQAGKEEIANSFVASFTSTDALIDYIRSLEPIATLNEKSFIDKTAQVSEIHGMQRFFLIFWTKRNGSDPEGEWNKYRQALNQVEKAYATQLQRGYETDRGRVYLQYGQPNSITRSEHEPSAYPYEIWHYYKIGKRSNVKFVFINEDLAGSNYELIHSDMIGEINNPQWQIRTHKRDTPFKSVDEDKKADHFGGRAGDYYDNPK